MVLNFRSQQDSKTRISLPYEDIFESAATLLRFPSTKTPVTDVPRARSDSQKVEDATAEEVALNESAEDEAAAVLLADDLRRFGELECTRKAMACICQVRGKSAFASSHSICILRTDTPLYCRNCPRLVYLQIGR